MSVLPHIRGTVLDFRFSRAGLDFTALPVTMILDGPTGGRIVLKWLDGGTDGALEAGGGAVLFTKPPPWSVANLVAGIWKVSMFTGARATAQRPAGEASMSVSDMPNGPPPVS